MRTLRMAAALAITLSIAAGVATAQPAQAALPPVNTSTFNIFGYGSFCTNGGTGCSLITGPEARYAEAGAYGAPGHTAGTPVHVYAECDRYYTDAHGHRIDAFLLVDNTYNGDSVTIRGTAAVGTNPDEANTASTGRMGYFATDSTTGDSAVVAGSQTADNVEDKTVSGGFTIVMVGTVYAYDMTAGLILPPGYGRQTCTTAGTALPSERHAAENEYEPYGPGG